MVTKKIIQKDKKGRVMTCDIGANAPNVTEDETHRFVTDDEKKEWGNKAADTVFTGANGSAAGQKGLVPKPDAVDYDKYLRGNGTWGSVDDMAPTFTPAVSRENIKSGEKNLTLFGKIAKFFSDLKAHAFSAPVNNGTSTSTTLALAASMGKTLMDKITKNADDINSLNSNFTNYYKKTETYSQAEVNTKVNERMPKSGGTFTGGITCNRGVASKDNITLPNTKKVYWDNGAAVFGNGAQHLFFMGADDGNYAAHLGVHDSMWTFDPDVSGNLQLGTANHKWGSLYAKNGAIQTSDRNLKKNVREINDKYIDFFMRLMPVSFQFNDGVRTHIGFIAQDVEEAMTASGLTDLDFAGFCRDVKTVRVKKTETVKVSRRRTKTLTYYEDVEVPNEYIYSLRYDEFIGLNTAMIQRLASRIEALESTLRCNPPAE